VREEEAMSQTDLLDEVQRLLRELRELQGLRKEWLDEYVPVYELEEGKPSPPGKTITPEAIRRLTELDEREQEGLQRLRDLREKIGKTGHPYMLRSQLDELFRWRLEGAARARDAVALRYLQQEQALLRSFLDDAVSSAQGSATTVDASVATLEKRVEELAKSVPKEFDTQLSEIRSDLDILVQTTKEQVTGLQIKAARVYELLEGATDIVAILNAKSHESRISSLEKRVDILSGEATTEKGLVQAIKSNWIAVLALVVAASLLILKIIEILGYFAA